MLFAAGAPAAAAVPAEQANIQLAAWVTAISGTLTKAPARAAVTGKLLLFVARACFVTAQNDSAQLSLCSGHRRLATLQLQVVCVL